MHGWIFDQHAPLERVKLSVAIGDTAIASTVADRFRDDLKERNKSDGACAFNFAFSEPLGLPELRKLSVRAEGTDYRLIPGRFQLVQCPPVPATPRLPAGMRRRFRHCVLHIGTERTGSTALQSFMALNRELLIDQGFYLPLCMVRPHGADHLNSWGLTMYALNSYYLQDQYRRMERIRNAAELAQFRETLVATLAEELEAAPAGCHTLVLSNENSSSGLLLEDEVRELRELLDLWCDSYSIIVYLRSQHSLGTSVSSMLLKAGQYDRRFQVAGRPPRLHNEYVPYFDYHAMLARWAAVFGKEAVQPRLWHEVPNRNVASDFQALLGLQHVACVPSAHRNSSLSAAAERFLIGLNGALASKPRPDANIVRNQLVPKLEKLSGEKLNPTRAEAAAFMAQFEEINRAVRDEWFPGRATLFEDDYSNLPENRMPLETVPAEFCETLIRALLVDEA